jgi:MarR family 2-MHQ and catechol resistance regulon transcriptional repressor
MGTHFKGTKKEINSLNTYIKLVRASESVRTRINEFIIKKGVTESQFYALDTLFHLGPLNQKELGDKLFRTGGNITLIIDNLEKQKLVRRERGEDRRCFTLHLTKKGKSLFEKLFPEQLRFIKEEMDLLSEDEQILMQKFCKILGLKRRD